MKKKVFITGGSRGIGEAAVRYFALKKNYDVTFTFYKNEEKANKILQELREQDATVSAFKMDLNLANEVESFIQEWVEKKEGFDIVIHNAAQTFDTPLFFMQAHEWNNVIQASLNSFFYITHNLYPFYYGP